jgi:ribosomal protein S18 acetylase RimI-like enzyme
VYASSRADEMRLVPWPPEQIEAFLHSQFELQHREYTRNYPDASFEVLVVDGADAGRLYVRRADDEVHVIDIALLPEFRRRGIGGALLRELMDEATAAGTPVSIYVEENNPAQSLYRRLGFQPVAKQGIYELMEWRPPGAAVT